MKSFHSILALGVLLSASPVLAAPSGLNNIPTADVADPYVLVIQTYSNFGSHYDQDLFAGFKTGLNILGEKFEIGADARLLPDEGGPVVLQTKWTHSLFKDGPTLGVGIANLALTSSERERAGDPFTYAVLSQDLESWASQPFNGGSVIVTAKLNFVIKF